jgi:hypothetical protein
MLSPVLGPSQARIQPASGWKRHPIRPAAQEIGQKIAQKIEGVFDIRQICHLRAINSS